MKPGRELDALVAEKVFGYKVYNFGLMSMEQNLTTIDSLQKVGILVPMYSTSIAHAWTVVEKLSVQQGFAMADRGLPGTDVAWQADFALSGPIMGESAPHAICLAALKAVGVDLENPEGVSQNRSILGAI